MRTYEEISARIMQKGDKLIENRRIKNTKIRQTTFALSGMCAAVITGAGIWHMNVKDKVSRTDNSSSVIEEPVGTTASGTSSLTTAKTTSSVTEAKTTEKTVTTVTETHTETSSAADTQTAASLKVSATQTSETRAEQSAVTYTQQTAAPQTTAANSQETATEPTSQDTPVTMPAIATNPVTIPAMATVPTAQTATVPSSAVTAPTSSEAGTKPESYTTTMPAEEAVDIEQKRFISFSEIAACHSILELGSSSYKLHSIYGNINDIPEGAAYSGITTVFGVDSVTGKRYFIDFEAYYLSDGNILVRFGESEEVCLYMPVS